MWYRGPLFYRLPLTGPRTGPRRGAVKNRGREGKKVREGDEDRVVDRFRSRGPGLSLTYHYNTIPNRISTDKSICSFFSGSVYIMCWYGIPRVIVTGEGHLAAYFVRGNTLILVYAASHYQERSVKILPRDS